MTTTITAEQLDDIERHNRASQYCSNHRRAKRLTNRLTEAPKQAFIDQFVASGRSSCYPFDESDLRDENELLDLADKPLVREVLTRQIGRAFERTHFRNGPEPAQLAVELLSSDCAGNLSDLEHLAIGLLSVDLVLGHVESLGFDLPKRTAASVARRCMLVLLNARLMRREP